LNGPGVKRRIGAGAAVWKKSSRCYGGRSTIVSSRDAVACSGSSPARKGVAFIEKVQRIAVIDGSGAALLGHGQASLEIAFLATNIKTRRPFGKATRIGETQHPLSMWRDLRAESRITEGPPTTYWKALTIITVKNLDAWGRARKRKAMLTGVVRKAM